jgi:FkbM family methyltransferase
MGLLRTLKRKLIERPFWIDHEPHLNEVKGVIHIGANIGQERAEYAGRGLRVLWVEPIPEIFTVLLQNIAGLADQRAVQALVTERAGERLDLQVASNNAGSSSILPMKLHTQVWPEVRFERALELVSESLPSLLQRFDVRVDDYDFLTVDTQGSELMVLRGAEPLLPHFRYVQVEVADFEAYAGGCLLPQVNAFFAEHGFVEHARHRFATRPGIGSFFDIVYRRIADEPTA